MKIKLNNKGSALVFSMLVLSTFLTLTAGYMAANVNENNTAKRHRESAKALWAAEAGLNEFIKDNTILDAGPLTYALGGSDLTIHKNDTDPEMRYVTATATSNGVTRSIQMDFPAMPFYALNNTLSTGGDLDFVIIPNPHTGGTMGNGALSVWGTTKITGTFNLTLPPTSNVSQAWFENFEANVDPTQTTLQYPDANTNGTPDDFDDFKAHNQQILSGLDSSEYVYIQAHDNATYVITPNNYYGKKMIYIEGDQEGQGDVDIFFAADLQHALNLTIVTTGKVSFIQPALNPTGSKLNTISWGDFAQSVAVNQANHEGITYTHNQAIFDVWGQYNSKGPIVANNGLYAESARHWERLQWADLVSNGLPTGFSGLIAARPNGYQNTPIAWREL